MSKVVNLHKAKLNANDEFYTIMDMVEDGMQHYNFENKIIYLSCDNYKYSNFFKYFHNNFEKLKLKKLIATYFDEEVSRKAVVYNGSLEVTELKGNGSFDSEECLEFIKEADIVITNPPFSKARYYYDYIKEHEKDFITLVPFTFMSYPDLIEDVKNDKTFVVDMPDKLRVFNRGQMAKPIKNTKEKIIGELQLYGL